MFCPANVRNVRAARGQDRAPYEGHFAVVQEPEVQEPEVQEPEVQGEKPQERYRYSIQCRKRNRRLAHPDGEHGGSSYHVKRHCVMNTDNHHTSMMIIWEHDCANSYHVVEEAGLPVALAQAWGVCRRLTMFNSN